MPHPPIQCSVGLVDGNFWSQRGYYYWLDCLARSLVSPVHGLTPANTSSGGSQWEWSQGRPAIGQSCTGSFILSPLSFQAVKLAACTMRYRRYKAWPATMSPPSYLTCTTVSCPCSRMTGDWMGSHLPSVSYHHNLPCIGSLQQHQDLNICIL